MTAATSVRPWRAVLAARADASAESMVELVADYVLTASPAQGASAFLSAWRVGLSTAVTGRLGGTTATVDLLRGWGYRETRGTRERWARLDGLDLVVGPGWLSYPVPTAGAALLPRERVLYRGASEETVTTGLSWTPSRRVALGYSRRRAGGLLWRCEPPSNAYLLGCAELVGSCLSDAIGPIPAVPEYLLDPAALDVWKVSR